MKSRLYSFLAVVTIIFFAFLAGFALLHHGLPPTHDGEYHVIRFYEFDKVLRSGILYPRWAPDLNYGYGIPLFNYVYPLPNYVSSLFHLFGTSFIDAFKLQMFFASIIGGVFFYLWTRHFWDEIGGVVSAIFYTFSPYRFVDIYIRGSVGEVWALGFFPAFLWAYTKFVKSKRKVFLVFSSIFLALIIFSHNILALIFFIFSLSYISLLIYREKNRKRLILNTLYITLLGLGLSAIFWLPAIYETKYVMGLQIFDAASHFPDLYQLLIPSWGSGFSGGELQNEISFQIGIANLISIFLSMIIIFLQIKRKNKKAYYSLYFLIWFMLVLFLMLEISKPVWQLVPFMDYFQFPWRLLSLEILFASFLAGSIFSLIGNKHVKIRIILAILLVFFAFILGIGYTKPAYYHYRDDNYYVARSNFIDGTNSPGNVFNTIWFNRNLRKQKDKITFKNNSTEVKTQSLTATNYAFNIVVKDTTEAIINTAYFPGWTVFVNNKKLDTKPNKDGIITFIIPKGEHVAEVKFLDTALRKIATTVSLVSLLVILTLFVFVKKNYVKIKR